MEEWKRSNRGIFSELPNNTIKYSSRDLMRLINKTNEDLAKVSNHTLAHIRSIISSVRAISGDQSLPDDSSKPIKEPSKDLVTIRNITCQ